MNEIPVEMIKLMPEKVLTYAPHAWVAIFVVRRIWQNWKVGGGWYGFKKAALFGEKIADAKAIDEAKDFQKKDEKRATQAPFANES